MAQELEQQDDEGIGHVERSWKEAPDVGEQNSLSLTSLEYTDSDLYDEMEFMDSYSDVRTCCLFETFQELGDYYDKVSDVSNMDDARTNGAKESLCDEILGATPEASAEPISEVPTLKVCAEEEPIGFEEAADRDVVKSSNACKGLTPDDKGFATTKEGPDQPAIKTPDSDSGSPKICTTGKEECSELETTVKAGLDEVSSAAVKEEKKTEADDIMILEEETIQAAFRKKPVVKRIEVSEEPRPMKPFPSPPLSPPSLPDVSRNFTFGRFMKIKHFL